MKKKVFVVFFIFSCNFTNAQICKSIDCGGVKNYLIGKIIFESVKGKPMDSELQNILDSNNLEHPANYSSLSLALDKNDFKETRKKLGDNIFEIQAPNVDKTKFASSFLELIQAKLNHKQDSALNFTNLKGQLITEINIYLNKNVVEIPEISKKAEVVKPADNLNAPIKNESPDGENTSSFLSLSNLNIFNLLALLSPIIFFLVLWRRISKSPKAPSDKPDNYQESFQKQILKGDNSDKISEFEKSLGNSRIIEEFRTAISRLQTEVTNLHTGNPNSGSFANPNITRELFKEEANSDIFYMKYPVENAFYNNHKSVKKENTIYKFTAKPNKIEAEFEVHVDGVKIEEILSMVERTIKSACNEENISSAGTRYIRTNQKGLVQLENDKWIIKRKAVIKYE